MFPCLEATPTFMRSRMILALEWRQLLGRRSCHRRCFRWTTPPSFSCPAEPVLTFNSPSVLISRRLVSGQAWLVTGSFGEPRLASIESQTGQPCGYLCASPPAPTPLPSYFERCIASGCFPRVGTRRRYINNDGATGTRLAVLAISLYPASPASHAINWSLGLALLPRANMHVKPAQAPPIPAKPQLHSAKCHHTYNGTRVLPIATWVRSPTVREDEYGEYRVVIEIVLYYDHNRACTIYRTGADFQRLRANIAPWKNMPDISSPEDLRGMHRFLGEALAKKRKECALEYFLRRKMGDCGGR